MSHDTSSLKARAQGLPLTENDGGSYVAISIACISALVAFVLIRGLGIRPPWD